MTKVSPEVLLDKVRQYAKACAASGIEKNLIPHPATWFNAERWRDTLEDQGVGSSAVKGYSETQYETALGVAPEFAKSLMILTSGINAKMSEATQSTWFQLLGDLPEDALRAAIVRHLSSSESPFLPPVGLIRRYAIEWSKGALLTVGEAWLQFNSIVKTWSQYEAATFSEAKKRADPLVLACGEQIGWRQAASSEHHESLRSRFMTLYEDARKAEDVNRMVPPSAKAGAGRGIIDQTGVS